MKKRTKRSPGNRGGKAARRAKSRNPEAPPKPSFEIEQLEPRILLSATWTGTDGADVFDGTGDVDEAYGLGGDDELHGGNKDDSLFGGDGDDVLFGDGHSDTLDGGLGDDELYGGNQDDVLIGGGGDDYMDGGNQDDTFRFTNAQDGDVITVVGGAQNDTLDLSGYSNNQLTDDGSTVTVDMGGGESFTVNYSEIESITTADGTYDPGDIPSGNDVPDAVDDSVSTTEDTPVTTGDLLANDADPDGDPLTVDSFTQGGNGSVAYNGDGTFTYTPNANFNGTDTFSYTVDDGNGGTDTATVSVTVGAANDAPGAVDDSVSTTEDTPVTTGDLLANDADPDGDPLTVDSFTQGGNGSVAYNGDGTFTYTPNANFNGTDTFSYTVDDGNGGTDTATVSVTVGAANDAPDAVAGADLTVDEGASVKLDASGSTDLDGDDLSYTWTQTGGPSVAFSDAGVAQPTFTAPEVSAVTTLTFQVEVSDGAATATDTVEVVVNPVADAAPPPPPPPPDPPPPVDEADGAGAGAPEEPVAGVPDVPEEPVVPDPVLPPSEPVAPPESPVDSGFSPPDVGGPTPDPVDTLSATPDTTPVTPDNGTAGAVADSTDQLGSEVSNGGSSGDEAVEWDGSEHLEVVDPLADMSDSVELDHETLDQPDRAVEFSVEPERGAELASRFEVGDVVTLPEFAAADAPTGAFVANVPDGATVGEVFEEVGVASDGPTADPVHGDDDSSQALQVQPRERVPSTSGGADEAALESRRGSRLAEDTGLELPPHGGGDSGENGAGGGEFGMATASSTQTGFFAGLWGAVRGLVGTSRRLEDRDSSDPQNRR